ncbi:hypothetical protein Plhal304r1_c090g0171311 [Plasmopara halstedii]
MTDKQKPREDVLKRLVCDLEAKKTLCCVKDYPGVELEQLNHYVKKFGPLVNPPTLLHAALSKWPSKETSSASYDI